MELERGEQSQKGQLLQLWYLLAPSTPTVNLSSVTVSPACSSKEGSSAHHIRLSLLATACKLGLEETLDNTVVSFGKHLFQ